MNILGNYFEIGFSLYGVVFNEVAGIYLIYTSGGRILDVGETDQLKTRLQNHERKLSWILNAGNESIFIAFHSEGNSALRLIKEQILRYNLNPVCGER